MTKPIINKMTQYNECMDEWSMDYIMDNWKNEYELCVDSWSLFTLTMTSKLGCDDFTCTIIYSLMS